MIWFKLLLGMGTVEWHNCSRPLFCRNTLTVRLCFS